MLTLFADCLAGTNARILVERFTSADDGEAYSLMLTSAGGLGLVQISGLSRWQVEALARGIAEVLVAVPEKAADHGE